MTRMRFQRALRVGRLGDVPEEVRDESAKRAASLAPGGRACAGGCGKTLSRYNKGTLCSQCQDALKLHGKART